MPMSRMFPLPLQLTLRLDPGPPFIGCDGWAYIRSPITKRPLQHWFPRDCPDFSEHECQFRNLIALVARALAKISGGLMLWLSNKN